MSCPDLLQDMGLIDFCSTTSDLRDDVLYIEDDKAARGDKQVLSLIALGAETVNVDAGTLPWCVGIAYLQRQSQGIVWDEEGRSTDLGQATFQFVDCVCTP